MDLIERIEAARRQLNNGGAMDRIIERIPREDHESGMFSIVIDQLQTSVSRVATAQGLRRDEVLALALFFLLDTDQYVV